MSRHEVVVRFVVGYTGEARHFNPDDVRFLAVEGIESHYDVEMAFVVETSVLAEAHD